MCLSLQLLTVWRVLAREPNEGLVLSPTEVLGLEPTEEQAQAPTAVLVLTPKAVLVLAPKAELALVPGVVLVLAPKAALELVQEEEQGLAPQQGQGQELTGKVLGQVQAQLHQGESQRERVLGLVPKSPWMKEKLWRALEGLQW